MNEQDQRILSLEHKLNLLLQKQEDFASEISALRQELNQLKSSNISETVAPIKEVRIQQPIVKEQASPSNFQFKPPLEEENQSPKKERNLEEFVGGNLLSKIGIIITIIGVAIGVKYSIDHDLISPAVRVLLGYVFGLSLMGIALKLKQKYFTYSAVLLSGSLTMLYFITFFAYSLYSLFPQILSFIIMLVITLYTVLSALKYNRQIIAHLGLVGAYAVPFLLSEGSGKVGILLSYMSIINVGILYISFFKKWRSILYSSFALSWIIITAWVFTDFNFNQHLGLGLVFTFIFFVTFYGLILAHKLIHKKPLAKRDILLLTVNSFLFFALGHFILDESSSTRPYLGFFTICIAAIHAFVSYVVYQQKLEKPYLFQYLLGLAAVFFTISIPIQLDGNWVTILWVTEATLLFSFGRFKKEIAFEQLAYPLLFLSLASLVDDWGGYSSYLSASHPEYRITPILNNIFLTSSIFILAYGGMNYIQQKVAIIESNKNKFYEFISYALPAIFLFSLYVVFRLEIENYWHQLYIDSAKQIDINNSFLTELMNQDLYSFSVIWVINYSLFFFGALGLINVLKLKNYVLSTVNLIISLAFILFFLTSALYEISELREAYLDPNYKHDISNYFLSIRYLSYPFIIFSLYSIYLYQRLNFFTFNYKMYFELLLSVVSIWLLSSELIGILNLADFNNSYKLGLSILWGSSSLIMIILGIVKQKKHLRIAAIVLFGITLIKLFFYDISHLGTIQKTVVFVSLGLLLLVISFLYNKFKGTLFED